MSKKKKQQNSEYIWNNPKNVRVGAAVTQQECEKHNSQPGRYF